MNAFIRARQEAQLDLTEIHIRAAYHGAVFYSLAYAGKLRTDSLKNALPKRSVKGQPVERDTLLDPLLWDAWAARMNRRFANARPA